VSGCWPLSPLPAALINTFPVGAGGELRFGIQTTTRILQFPMPLELGIWRIDAGVQQLEQRGLDLESRLEQILHGDVSMLSPNWMVIGRQVKTAYDKKIDLLCMDRDGNLIVIELKRNMTERDTVAQALDYGSWVRTVKADEIARIFDNYRRTYRSDAKPLSINEAFCAHFRVREMPEELNESHELVIAGSSFDSATERIVGYLASAYGVRINAVFFRVFRDGDREYLIRVWLREPTETDVVVDESRVGGDWNGEYYVSFGHDPNGRNWDGAVKYGFVSAGGGTWYSQTLRMLQPNSRVWV
jgi:Endonuclease NucS